MGCDRTRTHYNSGMSNGKAGANALSSSEYLLMSAIARVM
jgi:hypothetical protein